MCSGIHAPEAACPEIDWLWCAEIEPFPAAVGAHHHPQSRNLGDMTKVDWAAAPKVDVLVAGTPCQAFSVAGLRQSLNDHRGNLTLEFVRAAEFIQPRIIVWENVPGVLSTDDNAFGCLLAGLVGAPTPIVPPERWSRSGVVNGPKRSAAWRILDAQYFGLAQRRERVFVVASAHDWTHPGEILLEWESLRRDSPPSREAGKGVTGTLAARTSGGGGLGTDFDLGGGCLSRTLRAQANASHRADTDTHVPVTAMCLNGGGHEAD